MTRAAAWFGIVKGPFETAGPSQIRQVVRESHFDFVS